MLFINISSDQVHLADRQKELFLERNNIEYTLGPALIKWQKETNFSSIFLLNGPGGFTNLRVGTLVLNLLSKLEKKNNGLKIYSMTKLELFTKLYDMEILPQHGLIYIGQTKNIRKYDLKNKSYEKILLSTTAEYNDVFLDFVKGEYRLESKNKMINFSVKEKGLLVQYGEKETILTPKQLQISPQSQVRPEYMIEAVIN